MEVDHQPHQDAFDLEVCKQQQHPAIHSLIRLESLV
jgi:hypothetical protein